MKLIHTLLLTALLLALSSPAFGLKAAGLRFAYHHHAGDFMTADAPAVPGETVYDVLVAATGPDAVSFPLDVFRGARSGAKTADVIERRGSRIWPRSPRGSAAG